MLQSRSGFQNLFNPTMAYGGDRRNICAYDRVDIICNLTCSLSRSGQTYNKDIWHNFEQKMLANVDSRMIHFRDKMVLLSQISRGDT